MSNMNDDADDEYLDDPISLMTVEDIKTEICDDEDQIIDVSSDDEETFTSAYGKKNFVLPVTFFDISRNVRLLNKCKPLSIRIVDCKQHPTHDTKNQEKCRNKSDENCLEEENKCNDVSQSTPINDKRNDDVSITSTTEKKYKKQEAEKNKETRPNKEKANIVSINNVSEKDVSKQEGEKKRRMHRGDSFYEKLKKRKEERKRSALKCKDLSQVDFKKNTGLVGLKITDSIFKQIVDSEKALINTQCNYVENKSKEKNTNDSDKLLPTTETVASEDKDHRNGVEEALTISNRVCVEKICKENNEKHVSELENTLLFTTKTNFRDGENTEKLIKVVENVSIKKSTCMANKNNGKKNVDKDKANNKIDTDKNKPTEKSESIAEKTCILTKSIVVKLKENIPNNSVEASERSSSNSTKEKSKQVSNKYMKKVGAALDYLGTSLIPLTNTHTENKTKNANVQHNSKIDSIEAYITQANLQDKLGKNKEGSKIQCSLKIASNNVIEKVLKFKNTKPNDKNTTIAAVHQNIKEAHTKVDQIATNINLKRSKHNIDGFCVTSDKGKLQSISSQEVDHERKRAENAVKDANRDQAGPNSPVIPCTTITFRAVPPKLITKDPLANIVNEEQESAILSITAQTNTKKLSKHVNIAEPGSTPSNDQKQSYLPKIISTNQADSSNSKCTVTANHNEPVVPNAGLRTSCDMKGTLTCNPNTTSNIKTLKLTESKYFNSNTAAPSSGFLNDILAVTERSLSDQNISKMTPLKEADLINKQHIAIKSNISTVNRAINGFIDNQAKLNPQTNTPSTSQIPSRFSGNNAIILRRSLCPQFRQPSYPPPSQGHPIQTVVNCRLQYQPVQPGPRPMRFHHPPPCPPPPPPPSPPNNYQNLTQVRPMSPRFTYLRGMETGFNRWRFYNPPVPPISRPPTLVSRPLSPQVDKNSFIGNTANGDPIKKINLPAVTNTVGDKQKMLDELNNAMIRPSPNVTNNKNGVPSNHLKRKTDAAPLDPATPKHSRPGPLSKKKNLTTDLNTIKTPDKLSPKKGYSPPILPIFTYQESFKLFSPINSKNIAPTGKQNHTPFKRTSSTGTIQFDKDHKKLPHQDNGKEDKAKKISFEDYRKRAKKDDGDRIDIYKVKKHYATDDFNQDQGYDSDSTVKL